MLHKCKYNTISITRVSTEEEHQKIPDYACHDVVLLTLYYATDKQHFVNHLQPSMYIAPCSACETESNF